MMPYYSNINKCFIDLYKNDNLCFIINYMSQYTSEIINRVNSSIKTLSKEILNIYHFTRNKENSELYNILSNNYKTILFDIHKIFIYFRKNEVKGNKEDKDIDNVLVSEGLISDINIGQLTANFLRFNYVNLSAQKIPEEVLQIVPEVVARSRGVIAFANMLPLSPQIIDTFLKQFNLLQCIRLLFSFQSYHFRFCILYKAFVRQLLFYRLQKAFVIVELIF